MKTLMGFKALLVVAASSSLLLGCQETDATSDSPLEAKAKCLAGDWDPPVTGGNQSLPERFEAEELSTRGWEHADQRTERDSLASKMRVDVVRFKNRGGSIAYSFAPKSESAAEIWIRIRKGPDQAIFQTWIDDAKAASITIDGYSKSKVFAEMAVGAIDASSSNRHHPSPHKLHVFVSGKNPASSSFGITFDYIELRAAATPDPNPCANKPDGTTCDDGNACTQVDQCHAGKCVGGSPVVCAALDACHAVGACDQTTGACSNPAQPDGTACNDNNLCTQVDTCVAGACLGGTPVPCPAAPNCQVQASCAPDTGVCSAASECTPCGNGQLDPDEECDDGNLIPGDGCSAACKYEVCGDGIVQPTIQALTFYYLGEACNIGPTPVIFRINGVVVAQENLPESCDCQPGIRTVQVTDLALRAAGVNGSNNFELTTNGALAWVLGVVYTRDMGMGLPLWDYNGGNDVGNMNPDLCASGSLSGFGVGQGVDLSGGETCDDGNTVDGDGCSSTCQTQP